MPRVIATTRSVAAGLLCVWITLGAPLPASANVITDWDEKAVAATLKMPPYDGQRIVTMVAVAMFDAVNSIEPRYRPYLVQLTAAPGTSKEAAAAAAAASVLVAADPKTAAETKADLASYLMSVPDGQAKSDGVKLGETVAVKVLEARAKDGASAADAYRPKTKPGVYVPTPITAASMWPEVKPFAMTKPSQFRAPADLADEQGVGCRL
jgi:hypothetical protein